MTNKLQKIGALAVLVLFLLSIIPVALAEKDSNSGDRKGRGMDLAVNNNEKDAGSDGDKESNVEKIVGVAQKAEKGLQVAKQQIRAAREEYPKLKENFQEAKRLQKEQREQLTKLDKDAKKCDPETEECNKIKSELKIGVKNHLQKTSGVVNRALDKLVNRIENLEGLSAEEKDGALALITVLREELAPIQEKVDAFTADTSKEEIRLAIKEMKDVADKARKLQKRLVGLMINAKLHQLIVKHEEFRNGMQSRIDSLNGTGADVQGLKTLLKQFDELIVALKNDYSIAQNRWLEADTAEDFNEFVQDLHRAQYYVRKDLVETKQLLRAFIKEYKEIKRSVEQNAGNVTEGTEEDEANETEEAAEGSEETGEEQETEDAEEENEESSNEQETPEEGSESDEEQETPAENSNATVSE